MSDLISREELKRRMYHEAFETDSDLQKWDSGCWIRYKLFENVIDTIPSAEEVGHWIKLGDCEYRCSKCGKIIFADDENERYYCPSCGSHNLRR